MSGIVRLFVIINYLLVAALLPNEYVDLWAKEHNKSDTITAHVIVRPFWPVFLSLSAAIFFVKINDKKFP